MDDKRELEYEAGHEDEQTGKEGKEKDEKKPAQPEDKKEKPEGPDQGIGDDEEEERGEAGQEEAPINEDNQDHYEDCQFAAPQVTHTALFQYKLSLMIHRPAFSGVYLQLLWSSIRNVAPCSLLC